MPLLDFQDHGYIQTRRMVQLEDPSHCLQLITRVAALPSYLIEMSCADGFWPEPWILDFSRPSPFFWIVPESEEGIGFPLNPNGLGKSHYASLFISQHGEPVFASMLPHAILLRKKVLCYLLYMPDDTQCQSLHFNNYMI